MLYRALSIGLVAVASLGSGAALAGEVRVTLTEVRPNAGKLYVSLQSEEQFIQEDYTTGRTVENPQNDTVEVVLRDVPDGEYAISVWHDIDGDGTFSMGPQGPTDGWAMTNAAAMRGPPEFANHHFRVEGARTDVTERMIYGVRER